MTRYEFEQQQKNIRLLCRGVMPQRARDYVNELLAAQMPEFASRIATLNRGRREDEPIVVQVEHEPGPRGRLMSRLSDKTLEPSAARPQCGFNFMDLVLAGPLDGNERNYTCPQCGNITNITPPLFLED